jgi:hypothetical protein
MNGEVWVENLGQRAKITLGRGETGDFVFTSLQMGENWFTCSENPLEFAQWVYLVSPVAFRMALEGTKYDPSTKFVVCQTAKVTGSQPVLRFEWELTVQYLLCSCDGGGRDGNTPVSISVYPKIGKKECEKCRGCSP